MARIVLTVFCLLLGGCSKSSYLKPERHPPKGLMLTAPTELLILIGSFLPAGQIARLALPAQSWAGASFSLSKKKRTAKI